MQLHAAPVVVPIISPPIADGGVLVDGGRVVAVGAARVLAREAPQGTPVIEHDGALLPGFVNAHAHLQYGPGFADLLSSGHAFPHWLEQMSKRRRATSDEGWRQEVAGSWRMAYASGTVAVADIVTSEAALDVPVPGVRYLESVALPSAAWPEERARLSALLAAHPEAGLSPHTLYTLGADVLSGLNALARTHHRRLHPHLAETADEDEFVRLGSGPFAAWAFAAEIRDGPGTGRSPAAHLEALGGLGTDVHVAHGTHLDGTDRRLLKRRGTAVALCARSNAVLGAGVPPVAALLREGNPIAVGTDSLASSPDLDVLAEVRTLATIAAGQGYAGEDLAARLLAAATRGGADAIGRRDLGRIAPGAAAAFVHITVERPRATDIYAEIIASGRPHPVPDQADSIP
jgi:5-methylthioadenosine/S-adenosylhomocysteine deaminase